MTDYVRYVNTGASAGGDGTTNKTNGDSDRAYASLSEWEADEDGARSYGTTDRHIVHVTAESGSEDTGELNISGWTMTGNAEIIIQKHEDATDAILKPNGNGHAIEIATNVTYITFDGLEIDMSSMNGSSEEGFRVYADNCTIKNCKIHSGTTTQMDAIHFNYGGTDGVNCTIENCMIWDMKRAGIHVQASDNKVVTVANCTLWSIDCEDLGDYPAVGFYTAEPSYDSTMRVINTAAHIASGGGACYDDYGSAGNGVFTSDSDYNISSDTTAETHFGSTNSTNSVTFVAGSGSSGDAIVVSLTAGSEDLHAVDHANNILKDGGAGPTHSTLGSYVPTTDIDGDARSGATCNIGADEFAAAATVIFPMRTG